MIDLFVVPTEWNINGFIFLFSMNFNESFVWPCNLMCYIKLLDDFNDRIRPNITSNFPI